MAVLGARWPVELRDGDLLLRPLRMRDGREWRSLRSANQQWLQPWEATLPQHDPDAPSTYAAMVRTGNREARAGRSLPFGIFCGGRLVGQITVGGIAYSSLRTCHIGYWIDSAHAGRGIMPRALALVADYCLGTLGLHRVEVNIRPENAASLAVVRKLGFRNEGLRERYLHIDGDWRDHWSFALTAEDRPEGLRSWAGRRDSGNEQCANRAEIT